MEPSEESPQHTPEEPPAAPPAAPAPPVQPLGIDKRIGVILAIVLAVGIGYVVLSRRGTEPQPAPGAPPQAIQIQIAETVAKQHPSPENYLNLSLACERGGRFQESLAAARQALQLRPDYAEAWNNVAAAYEDMRQWDAAIAAAQEALKLKPDFQLARNNLAWSLQQKAAAIKEQQARQAQH